MFRNFYKIVLRNMWRYKGYTLLNIFGMGIGFAAIVWGFGVNSGIAGSTLINSVIVLYVIAGITSGIKVWQAVRTNPVKLLRIE